MVTDSDTAFLPAQVQKRINVYWFLSLLPALSSASTGMLCKQWLQVYIRDAGRSSKDVLCVRQMRLEGLSAWKVEGIISTIPLSSPGRSCTILHRCAGASMAVREDRGHSVHCYCCLSGFIPPLHNSSSLHTILLCDFMPFTCPFTPPMSL